MSLLAFAILCFSAGVLLLVAEVLLPSHGLLGILGALGLLAGVVACFRINQYAGVAAAVAIVALSPFAAALWVKVWPHTFAGKRLILGPPPAAAGATDAPAVQVGHVGVVASELRPSGTCDFGAARLEARSERGMIPAGRRVEVIALVDGRPLVREI